MDEAIESMNDEELDGRYITVNESSKRPDGGGGMEAGGRGGGRGGARGGGGSAPVGVAPKGSRLSRAKLNAPIWCVPAVLGLPCCLSSCWRAAVLKSRLSPTSFCRFSSALALNL